MDRNKEDIEHLLFLIGILLNEKGSNEEFDILMKDISITYNKVVKEPKEDNSNVNSNLDIKI